MTEAQAKTKLCPIVAPRIGWHTNPQQKPTCLASGCMMWRLSYVEGDDGFCGLAGSGGPYGYPPPSTN